MIRYAFNDGVGPLTIKNASKADPQKIGQALAGISASNDGHLTPKAVVQAARASNHVLHKHFEWNDKVAAEHYRENQARILIRCIQIVDHDEDRAAPAFLSVADKSGVSYRTLDAVMGSAELQSAVLKQAERDLIAFEKRYAALEDICDLIRDIREKVSVRRSNMESRAPN